MVLSILAKFSMKPEPEFHFKTTKELVSVYFLYSDRQNDTTSKKLANSGGHHSRPSRCVCPPPATTPIVASCWSFCLTLRAGTVICAPQRPDSRLDVCRSVGSKKHLARHGHSGRAVDAELDVHAGRGAAGCRRSPNTRTQLGWSCRSMHIFWRDAWE